MFIKQLSVFIENRAGRLEEVTEILKQNGINITSLSLADTSEYGMLRMIVSDPTNGRKALKDAGFSVMLTDVIAAKLPNGIGMLNHLLKILNGVNIEYMYALATNENAALILKISNNEAAVKALKENGIELLGDIAYTIND